VEVDFPDPLQEWQLSSDEAALNADATYESALSVVRQRISVDAAGFLARMDARLERDRQRLKDYYNALRRESKKKQQRPRATADSEQSAVADRAVELELRRKLAELEERYAMDATIRPLVVIQTQVPVVEISLSVHRKQAKRKHVVYWNSLTKGFEPVRCASCGGGTYSVAFTNDEVAPLCAACSQQAKNC
jgi:proline dehydrogenase